MSRLSSFVSALICLPFLVASCLARSADFSTLSTSSAASVSLGGITVTGSSDVNIWTGVGLGIVGGAASTMVDGSESIQFVFTSGAAVSIEYWDYAAWDLNSDGVFGERTLEAFGVNGLSLGTVTQSNSGYFAVSSVFGNVPISKFVLTANGDASVIRKIWFTTVPGAPTIDGVIAGDATAIVSFTPPGDNGGAAITGYIVTSDPGGITASGTASPIKVTGLADNVAYTFTVRAINNAGAGAASEPSQSVTPLPLSVPTLSEWALILLGTLLAAIAIRGHFGAFREKSLS